MTTPINTSKLSDLLQDYPREEHNFLIKGFQEGFRIPFTGTKQTLICKNHKSAMDNPMMVDQKLESELKAGRIKGPFDTPPVAGMRLSPIGLIPKKQPGCFRLIQDLSSPKGESVNDGIPKEHCSVQYETLDIVISYVLQCGPGALVSKTDIKDAFRICPIHPDSQPLLGFTWKNKFYMDSCLPMGLSFSCQLFERFSRALQWIMQRHYNVKFISHILDDFMIITVAKPEEGQRQLEKFMSMAKTINLPIKEEKTCLPSSCVIVHGIELDSKASEVRLPSDKQQKARDLLADIAYKRRVTLHTLQSLIGFLNFACKVVVPGRPFLRRLIDLTVGLEKPYHHVSLDADARADIAAWQLFMEDYNGKCLMLDYQWQNSQKLHMYSDAAGGVGYGAFLGTRWFVDTWPSNWLKLGITFMELYPIVTAVVAWAEILKNKCVLFHTDNEAVAQIVNKLTSKHPAVMVLVRKLIVTCMSHNILFKAVHIRGLYNSVADALSRLDFQRVKKLAPWLDKSPTPIPQALQPQNFPLKNSWLHH